MRNKKSENPDQFSPADEYFMTLALSLAEKGLYSTTPNPRVGCVVVKDNNIIARGYHEKVGAPHAEIHALSTLKPDEARGATLYVTLEPCCHYGKTGPCVDRIIAEGIARVVVSTWDPNPLVCGQSIKKLQECGITTQWGLCAVQAETLNRGFYRKMRYQMPWIRLKIANSLDGRTALANGESQWITNEACRRDVHHWRAQSCAIMTGIGTILADDPMLNVRHQSTSRQPALIICDSHLRIPMNARCLTTTNFRPVIVAHTEHHTDTEKQLHCKGVTTLLCPQKAGRVDLLFLVKHLAQEWNMLELWVECGATLASSFYHNKLIDELIVYVGSKILGNEGRPSFLMTHHSMRDIPSLILQECLTLDNDIRLIYTVNNTTYSKIS